MGRKFSIWEARSQKKPLDFSDLEMIIYGNRDFLPLSHLNYGDYGLEHTLNAVADAIANNRKIALYADYDVDGTMSCVSWIWFFKAIGFKNYTFYIPDRFSEGYGVNLAAMKKLIDEEGAQLVITMDTGITANVEAAYCRSRGVAFICTDHHKIQPEKMPDTIILNPKQHPDPAYQELCGCGITFVLLRQLGRKLGLLSPEVWNDLLALAGIATICDVVPLNPVNHKIAKMGVEALLRSNRRAFKDLRHACALAEGLDEKDIGFRIGPRINAVGRLKHAKYVVDAFLEDDPRALIEFMEECNEKRRDIQSQIVEEALVLAAAEEDAPIIFLGGAWHTGVVGIAASKIAETFWRPTWLFDLSGDVCKGSARSIPGFDVTEAMIACSDFFTKFGGHAAAGGFQFERKNLDGLKKALISYGQSLKNENPELWQSRVSYDCHLPTSLTSLPLVACLDGLKPFGHGFDEPRFLLRAAVDKVMIYNDKKTGQPKHTAMFLKSEKQSVKIMFFNEVIDDLSVGEELEALVTAQKNVWRGRQELSLFGVDLRRVDV